MKTVLNKNAKGYGYKYTDIAEIHNYLEENNMRYIQRVERIDGDDYIFTKRCINDEWENEWLQGCRVVQATLTGVKNPAQEQGSALTYARRYSLLMSFGLSTSDDDAQSLSVPKTKEEQEEKLRLMKELNRLFEEKDIDRDEVYQTKKVKEMKELTIKQLKELINDLSKDEWT